MQKRVVIDRIEIEPQTGHVGVRMRKQLVNDDGSVDELGFHRTMIGAGADPAVQIAAVDEHLAAMGFPSVKAEDVAVLNASLAAPVVATMRTAKAEEALAKAQALR